MTDLPPLGAVLHHGTLFQYRPPRGLVIGILPPTDIDEERTLVVIEDPIKFKSMFGDELFMMLCFSQKEQEEKGRFYLSESQIKNPESGLTKLHLRDIPGEYQDQWKLEFELEGGQFCHVLRKEIEK